MASRDAAFDKPLRQHRRSDCRRSDTRRPLRLGEAEAPRPVDLPVEGAASVKAAVITVELHYTLTDPLA